MNKLTLLTEFLKDYQHRPFETGVNDCALFVADWAKVLTGHDFAEHFRGLYQSDFGSTRLIKKRGYKDLADLMTSTLNEHATLRENPMLAQRGDIAWVKGRTEHICGVVVSGGVAVLSSNGITTLSILQVEKAWDILNEAQL